MTNIGVQANGSNQVADSIDKYETDRIDVIGLGLLINPCAINNPKLPL